MRHVRVTTVAMEKSTTLFLCIADIYKSLSTILSQYCCVTYAAKKSETRHTFREVPCIIFHEIRPVAAAVVTRGHSGVKT